MADFWGAMFGGRPSSILDSFDAYNNSAKNLAAARNAKIIAALNQVKLNYAPRMAQQDFQKGAADVSIEQNKANYAPRMSAATLAGLNLTNQGKAIDNRYAPMIKQLEIRKDQIANAISNQKFKDLPAQDQAAMHLQDAQTSLALAKAKQLGATPAKGATTYIDDATGHPIPGLTDAQAHGAEPPPANIASPNAAPISMPPSIPKAAAAPPAGAEQDDAPDDTSAPAAPSESAPPLLRAPLSNAPAPKVARPNIVGLPPEEPVTPPMGIPMAPPVSSAPTTNAATPSVAPASPAAPNASPVTTTAPASGASNAASAAPPESQQTFPGANPKAMNVLAPAGVPDARGHPVALQNLRTGERFAVLTSAGREKSRVQLIALRQAVPYMDDLIKYGSKGKFQAAGMSQLLPNSAWGVSRGDAVQYQAVLNKSVEHVIAGSALKQTETTLPMIHAVLARQNWESSEDYTNRIHEFQHHLQNLENDTGNAMAKGYMSIDRYSAKDEEKYLTNSYNKLMAHNTVDVIRPDGTEGTIPRENLEKALSRGYKRAS